MPLKTDRRDAEGYARLPEMGWFRQPHFKVEVLRTGDAGGLELRKSLQQTLDHDLELSLRGVLRNFGLRMGTVSGFRSEARASASWSMAT